MRHSESQILRDLFKEKRALHCVDSAPTHMNTSMCKVMRKLGQRLNQPQKASMSSSSGYWFSFGVCQSECKQLSECFEA